MATKFVLLPQENLNALLNKKEKENNKNTDTMTGKGGNDFVDLAEKAPLEFAKKRLQQTRTTRKKEESKKHKEYLC